MSLKAFHVAFIFLSNLLALGFGAWCLREAGDTGNMSFGIMGVLSLLSFVALFAYGMWFLKKAKGLSYFVWAFAILGSVLPIDAKACAVCLGNPNSPLVIGANAGITFLMGIIVMVLAAFGSLFLFWRKREKTWIKQNELHLGH